MRDPRRGGVRMAALAVLAVLAAGVTACSSNRGGKSRVAVSIFPLHDITRRVAGDRLDVVLVLPPGKSEHGYDPSPRELARLEGTRLGIAVGLGMDGWVEGIMRSAGGTPRMVHVGEQVPTLAIDVEPLGEAGPDAHHGEHGHGEGAPDPHFWMDPTRMSVAVDVIAAELTTLDPAGEAVFAANAATLKQALVSLDRAITARAASWRKRTIVTFHGSMTYYAAHYGLRIAAVVEPKAGTEPTPQYVARVLAAIRHGQAAALFSEPQLDRRPAEVIAREGQLPLGELDPVGGGPGRDSYEALLTWNTDQLETLLQ